MRRVDPGRDLKTSQVPGTMKVAPVPAVAVAAVVEVAQVATQAVGLVLGATVVAIAAVPTVVRAPQERRKRPRKER